MSSLGPLAVVAIILAVSQAGTPQALEPNECNNQAIVFNARDKQGKFLPSLQAADFRVKLGGRDVNITNLGTGAGAPRVIILLDISGSFYSEAKRSTEKLLADELIRSLPETTQFALVAFGSRVLETLEFGHSRAEILSAIERLTSSPGKGPTALRDVLVSSTDLFGPAQIGDSVVVLSDGQDNESKTSFAAVQHAYWSKAIRIFLAEVIDHYFQTGDDKSAEHDSEDVTVGTGGMVHRILRPEVGEILAASHEIGDTLSNYYIVQVGSLPSEQAPTSLQVQLVDSSGRRNKDVRLS